MSILNVLLNNDRLLVAVDTLAEDAYTRRHSARAKLLLIPQHNLVLASRGTAHFFLKIYELCLQASFLADFTVESLALEIGPTMDRLWPGYLEAAEAAGLPVHDLRTEIVLGGWSSRLGRMTATAYAKRASETPALIQPLIGGLASPGEPLRGRPDSFDPVEVFQAGVLQASYLNDKNGRQVAGGSLLVAHLRQREARINEWPFVQPGLVRKERKRPGSPPLAERQSLGCTSVRYHNFGCQCMSERDSQVPFQLRAINAEAVGELLGVAGRTVLETIACRPDFPVRVSMRPATWIAGEVLEWRGANRAGRRVRGAAGRGGRVPSAIRGG